MTMQEITDALNEIRSVAYDDGEYAHVLVDQLYLAFVTFIASQGPDDVAKMATLILSTQDIDFTGWCG